MAQKTWWNHLQNFFKNSEALTSSWFSFLYSKFMWRSFLKYYIEPVWVSLTLIAWLIHRNELLKVLIPSCMHYTQAKARKCLLFILSGHSLNKYYTFSHCWQVFFPTSGSTFIWDTQWTGPDAHYWDSINDTTFLPLPWDLKLIWSTQVDISKKWLWALPNQGLYIKSRWNGDCDRVPLPSCHWVSPYLLFLNGFWWNPGFIWLGPQYNDCIRND